MATAILRHEALSLRHHSLLGSRRNPNPNPNMIMLKSNHEFSRKRNPVGFKSINKRQSESMVTKPPGKNLVMGQVKILKRGEPLVAATEKTDRRCSDGSRGDYEVDLSLGSTNRLGPDPETMQKQIKLKEFKIGSGFYAGSSSLVSPPPSLVPVPEFLGRTARVWGGSSSKVLSTVEMREVHEYLDSREWNEEYDNDSGGGKVPRMLFTSSIGTTWIPIDVKELSDFEFYKSTKRYIRVAIDQIFNL
ncbi:hypothetical protein PVK06_019955 [Gossypium arboreum]|uniref:Uncharacterized protein n=1 Tax=Gossypium arboreum TaxID=29729 RepID=A0ABR0PLQ1_GOSAR|nr:hypothetical protein PVK06_019955 [Gossypium arboreum]